MKSALKTAALLAFATAAVAANAQFLTSNAVAAGVDTATVSQKLRAVGTSQTTNFKSYLEVPGASRVTANTSPAQFWNNTQRSWSLNYDATTKRFTWQVFSTNNWSGNAAMTTTSLFNPANLPAGQSLVGLRTNIRTTQRNNISFQNMTISDVAVNAGSGWENVADFNINRASGVNGYGSTFSDTLYFRNGLKSFTLRGKTLMAWQSGVGTTSDFLRFEAQGMAGVQAVPEPATMAVLGLGALGLIRRKRKQA